MTLYRIRPHNWRLIDGKWIATEPRCAAVEQASGGGWLAWTEGDHEQQADETTYATAEQAMRHVEERHREQFLPYLEVVNGS